MVDSATGKVVGERVVGEHVTNRVWLTFDPEVVSQFDVMCHVEDFALAGIGNHVIVIGRGNGSNFVPEVASEVVVPAFVAVVFSLGVTDEEILEPAIGKTISSSSYIFLSPNTEHFLTCVLMRGLVRRIGHFHNVLLTNFAKPPLFARVEYLGGLRS